MNVSLPPLVRRGLAGWLLWTSLAVHVPIAIVAVSHSTVKDADFDNYYNIGTRPGQPYKDFRRRVPGRRAHDLSHALLRWRAISNGSVSS